MNKENTKSNQRDGMMVSTKMIRMIRRHNRCCYSLLHVTTATMLIGCVEICYFSYEIFSTIYHFIQTGEQYFLSLSMSLFGILLALIASVLLFVAVKTSTPYLLVPHLLMQAATVCILSLICLFCLFALLAGTSLDFRIINVEDSIIGDLAFSMTSKSTYEHTYISETLIMILSFICIFLLLLSSVQVWMLIIVFGCFFHLQEKAISKTQCLNVNNKGANRLQVEDCAIDDAKNNNCISLEMNSIRNS
ncbi:Levansucrase [Dirofilaria immitis]